jgi:hypothetical protein
MLLQSLKCLAISTISDSRYSRKIQKIDQIGRPSSRIDFGRKIAGSPVGGKVQL